MLKKARKLVLLAGFNFLLMALSAPGVAAVDMSTDVLSRGEATDLAVKYLNLEKKNVDFLRNCKTDPGTCLFTFSTRTNFQIMLKPVILYPDVYPAYRYYKSINVASELDLVRGYFDEDNSPFKPEQPISRVEALKLVFGATNILPWKEKFELAAETGDTAVEKSPSWTIFGLDTSKWWYGRYLAAAQSNGFWQVIKPLEADEGISRKEFLDLLKNANTIVANRQASSLADNNGQSSQKADTSANIRS